MEKSCRGVEALCAAEDTTKRVADVFVWTPQLSASLHIGTKFQQQTNSCRMSRPGIINHACADSIQIVEGRFKNQNIDLGPYFLRDP